MGPRILLLLAIALSQPLPALADTLITHVRLVDGTGGPAVQGELRIADGRIAALGPRLDRKPDDVLVDGGGQVLAPGFIDSHSHLDRTMFTSPDVPGAVNQGVTTIIIGQDGYSDLPTSQLKARLAERPVAVNVGTYSGHNDLRRRVMGDARALAVVVQRLAGVELGAAVGKLDDRRRLDLGGGFHDGVDRAGIDHVDGRQREFVGLGEREKGLQIITGNNARLHLGGIHGFHFQCLLIEPVIVLPKARHGQFVIRIRHL